MLTTANESTTDCAWDFRLQLAAALGELDALGPDPVVEHLRNSAPLEDEDGNPLWPAPAPAPPPAEPQRQKHPGVQFPLQRNGGRRPSHAEVEDRISQIQLWIAQRQPSRYIRERAFELWGITSTCTLRKYVRAARARMTQELMQDRSMHIAEQIHALMDVARRAADAEQFNASVGAYRVIAEIAGILRAPIKAPTDARG